MSELLTTLRAAADPTRLRLLALCARAELTVSELVRILGQSQPRVSRHLKLLTEAGLLDRVPEGSWVFHRLVREGEAAEIAARLVGWMAEDEADYALDLRRLREIERERERKAAAYFRRNAAAWHRLRALYVEESEVETALQRLVGAGPIDSLLDIGTGTGRLLELFAPKTRRVVGVDLSSEMLAVARANLEKAGIAAATLRKADMYQLPFPGPRFDAVTIHQVLHFADSPGGVIGEAARVMRPGGRLVIADFAPHDREELRRDHEHRRLGFADEEITGWFRAAGLKPDETVHLKGDPLTVSVWSASKAQGRSRKGGHDGR
jgi:SAM-dependent methyltransferase/DNA-binding transcriptional ArsR family regulator